MLPYLLRLYAHEQWANARIYDALNALPSLPPRTQQLVPHIIGAHQFWDQRLIQGRAVNFWEYDFFPKHNLAECAALNDEYLKKWTGYLNSLTVPVQDQTLTLTVRGGERKIFSVVDILTQLHEHSVYHRGQIAADLRAAGVDPINQDYIYFCGQAAGE